MRVSFTILDAREIQAFFKSEMDFLDILVRRDDVTFISSSAELYAHYSVEVLSREDFEKDVCFRVPRKRILEFMDKGIMTMYIDTEAQVEYMLRPSGTNNEFRMEYKFQSSDLSPIYEKLELLQKSKSYTPINLFSLSDSMRVMRNLTNVISVRDGYAVAQRPGMAFYAKADCRDLSLSTNVVTFLLRFSEDIYGYQNFIIGRGQGCVIIARQVKSSDELDLKYALSEKYTHSFKIEFQTICELVKRCKITEPIILDFERESAKVREGNISYGTKFKIKDIKSITAAKQESLDIDDLMLNMNAPVTLGSTHNLPTLRFPVEVLSEVISSLRRSELTLKVKKNIIQIQSTDKAYYVLVRRSDVAS